MANYNQYGLPIPQYILSLVEENNINVERLIDIMNMIMRKHSTLMIKGMEEALRYDRTCYLMELLYEKTITIDEHTVLLYMFAYNDAVKDVLYRESSDYFFFKENGESIGTFNLN